MNRFQTDVAVKPTGNGVLRFIDLFPWFFIFVKAVFTFAIIDVVLRSHKSSTEIDERDEDEDEDEMKMTSLFT